MITFIHQPPSTTSIKFPLHRHFLAACAIFFYLCLTMRMSHRKYPVSKSCQYYLAQSLGSYITLYQTSMMEFFSENCNREKAESSMFHKAVNTTRWFSSNTCCYESGSFTELWENVLTKRWIILKLHFFRNYFKTFNFDLSLSESSISVALLQKKYVGRLSKFFSVCKSLHDGDQYRLPLSKLMVSSILPHNYLLLLHFPRKTHW